VSIRTLHHYDAIALLVPTGRTEAGYPRGDAMEMKELFGGFDPAQYEAEVEKRWGGAALDESKRRVTGYTAEDWTRQQAEQGAIYGAAAEAMKRGVDPASPAAMDIAERHRLSIDTWFYPCTRTTHAGLADMYEADERFRASIDRAGDGLTTFLSAAIRANAAR
jgi:hypothetical protein